MANFKTGSNTELFRLLDYFHCTSWLYYGHSDPAYLQTSAAEVDDCCSEVSEQDVALASVGEPSIQASWLPPPLHQVLTGQLLLVFDVNSKEIRQGFCLPLYEQVFGIWCIWYLVYLAFGIKYEDYLNSLPNIYL